MIANASIVKKIILSCHHKIKKNWDRDTKVKAQWLKVSLSSFQTTAVFITTRNIFDEVKVIASKLQNNHELDAYDHYEMVSTKIENINTYYIVYICVYLIGKGCSTLFIPVSSIFQHVFFLDKSIKFCLSIFFHVSIY